VKIVKVEPPLASFSQIGFTWEKRTRQPPWKEKKKEQEVFV